MVNSKKTLKSNIVKRLKNTYCRLKPSKISGVGVFAVRDIPKNQNPFQGIKYNYHELKTSDFKNFDKEVLKMIDNLFVIGKNGKVWVPESGLNGMDVSFFVNHSENPNLKTIDDGSNFITLRKVKKGEELTVSYGTYDWKY